MLFLSTTSIQLLLSVCGFLVGHPRRVSASGVFEINLEEFVNEAGRREDGRCCVGSVERAESCSEPCRTAFHVCFTHFQSKLSDTSPCTFGSVKTPVLGYNSFGLKYPHENLIKLNFSFTWPGTFSLVIEATHEQRSQRRHSENSDPMQGKRIAKIMKQGNVAANEDWKTETRGQNDKILRFSYRVRCDMHYYGKGCSQYCRPRDDMFGHYTCDMNGMKVCLPGWKSINGTYCTEPICLPGCSTTHGYCRSPNQCICRQGWEGSLCDKCQKYPGCQHGTCTSKFECECEPGWGGMFCNLDLNYCTHHKPCKNGARCTNVGQGSYACDCPPGFTGRKCESILSACEPNPCKNDAKCTSQGNDYTCECQDKFFGHNCEKTLVTCQHNPCRNGGSCVHSNEQYRCTCMQGFYGVNCEEKVKRCSSTTCFNGGNCEESHTGFVCACPDGYSGRRCELPHSRCDRNACKNEGRCIVTENGYKCECQNGFHGAHCDREVKCGKGTCKNGGSCDVENGYTCKCKIGFSGKNCGEKNSCGVSCKNGGVCNLAGGSCQCKRGYSGKSCERITRPSSLHGQPLPIDDNVGYVDNSKTRIIVLTKNENGGLNTAQWIAVCFASGFVLLLFVAIAICVAYHRRGKSGYTGGRTQKTYPRHGNSDGGLIVERRQTDSLLNARSDGSKMMTTISSHKNSFGSEIMVASTAEVCYVPSGESTTKLPADLGDSIPGRSDKRSSIILCEGRPADTCFKRLSTEYTNRSRCGLNEVDTSEPSGMNSFIPRSVERSAKTRHTDGVHLPTYQEACKDGGFPGSHVV